MHIHILGICGTFMGSLAQLAKSLGHHVTGSDANVYPPMSTQLESAGIEIVEGFSPDQLEPEPDIVVVGNVISRGNPAMEAILNKGLNYTSGPQWLADNLLKNKWVLAVAGTHGKTTTSSMLAWILEYSGYEPGYLIGGVPGNFTQSARLGNSDFFVIEADEYDTSFFDKRSKFVHYHPNTLLLNNLEFDHADIFEDLGAIQKQFHHVVRTVPSQGLVIYPQQDEALNQVIDMGCWSETQTLGDQWNIDSKSASGHEFTVQLNGETAGQISWSLTGEHNINNALGAIAAARHVGVEPKTACEALNQFKGVKRRMELLGEPAGIKIYDDFAHHPTAIKTTLDGLRAAVGDSPVYAIIEPRSNTMKKGTHKQALADSVAAADQVIWFQPEGLAWDLNEYVEKRKSRVYNTIEKIIDDTVESIPLGAHLVIMSNGGFGGIHNKLLTALANKEEK